MEYTKELEDSESELTPLGVLAVVLGDINLAIECLEALDDYANELEFGNNQVPAILFFGDGPIFGAVDLWSGDEEVM